MLHQLKEKSSGVFL